uniref:SCP domain-containing protein n=1 Tax=Trichobilharzia regenti TaxID=157069 RepID=A0AA85IWH1_TRIRE|nr:unnamed protein product [Trichobilharzia regenti]
MLSLLVHITLLISLAHAKVKLTDDDFESLFAHNFVKKSFRFWQRPPTGGQQQKQQQPQGRLSDFIWDVALARQADRWAQKCTNSRTTPTDRTNNTNKTVGQNVAISEDIGYAVMTWALESMNYNATTDTCRQPGRCDSYKNLAQSGTVYLGCGQRKCPNITTGREKLFVCNYSPEDQ